MMAQPGLEQETFKSLLENLRTQAMWADALERSVKKRGNSFSP